MDWWSRDIARGVVWCRLNGADWGVVGSTWELDTCVLLEGCSAIISRDVVCVLWQS